MLEPESPALTKTRKLEIEAALYVTLIEACGNVGTSRFVGIGLTSCRAHLYYRPYMTS